MTSKVYAYLGKNQATIDIPISNMGALQVEFSGGNIYDEKNYKPATTGVIIDPVIQAVIERSAFFGNEIIIFEQVQTEDGSHNEEPKEYPDVTNFAEAVALLKSEYQVSASQLRSQAGVRNLAASLNISFPNWA